MPVELARNEAGEVIVQHIGGAQAGRLFGRRGEGSYLEIVLMIDYEDYPWREGCSVAGIELIPAVAEMIQELFNRERWQWQRSLVDDLLIMQLCLL